MFDRRNGSKTATLSLSLYIYMYVGIYVYIRATSGNDASEKSYFTRVAGLIVGFSTRFLAGE